MKVRIYKSLDGNGKYLNKTGQFLEKAQKGKIVKDVLKYGKQLIMNFDETDKIQKATKLAKYNWELAGFFKLILLIDPSPLIAKFPVPPGPASLLNSIPALEFPNPWRVPVSLLTIFSKLGLLW